MNSTRAPWSRRHPTAFAVLSWAVIIGFVTVVVLAACTPVTVPLLWPAGTTALLVALGVDGLYRRRGRQRAAAEQERLAAVGQERASMTVSWALSGRDNQRIGTAERHAVLDFLHERYGSGHLDDAALESRRSAALTAVYRRDLAELIADLPR